MAPSTPYGSNDHQRRRQRSIRSEKPWATQDNGNYDEKTSDPDDEVEVPRSQRSTRYDERLEGKAGQLSQEVSYPHVGPHSDRADSAKVRNRGIRYESRAARPDRRGLARDSPNSQRDGNFLLDIVWDVCGMMGGLYYVLRRSYRILKWPILFYLLWIMVTHSLVALRAQVSYAVEPYCEMPVIGNLVPFCPRAGGQSSTSATSFMSKVISSQEEFTGVSESVGQDHEQARSMTKHEWVLRDLKIRVATSKLSRKKELENELATLIQLTEEAAWGFSAFTARFSKATAVVIAIDEDVMTKLATIEERENHVPTWQEATFSRLSPFSAFRSTGDALTEGQLKDIFFAASAQMAKRLPPSIQDAWELHGLFQKIQATLERIRELTIHEMDDLPHMDILSALWIQLAQADKHAETKTHKELLENLTGFYKSFGERTMDTIDALKRISTELKSFRDEYANARLLLGDLSLKVIASTLRKSMDRLTMGQGALEEIEGRERKAALDDSSMRTVRAIGV